ncbi:MAG: hypothetical protein WBF53_12480 [Litorimonas sp.]
MTPVPHRPELNGYAEAVRAEKRKDTAVEPGAFWLLLLAGGLFCLSSAARDWIGLGWMSGVAFSLATVFALAAVLLAFNVLDYPGVAQRLEIAKTRLAAHMGWTWRAVETDKAGHPLTAGHLKGEAGGLFFEMKTTASSRELRFALPESSGPEPSARDFHDLQAIEAERARRRSADGFPETRRLVSGRTGQSLGRKRSLSVRGGTLCIACTPYKERGLAEDANIRRRMREAEAILTLAESVRKEWQADLQPHGGLPSVQPTSTPR